ncbi:MAG: ATP-dependent DNA helicase, partial [Candidatus Tantalella remota]|nr:ATP-dependent DNA helicase [Candidatus Tantalella remota]
MTSIKHLFEEGGAIAENMQGYQVRSQQLQMVEAIEEAIEAPDNLILEAGTGTGKSLAYLVPLIYWAVRAGRKVVISTYTRALQNQLFVKDLPFLERSLDVEFKYALCMGAENYACLKKSGRTAGLDLFRSKKRKEQVRKVSEWLEHTESGLRTDMDFVPESAVWEKFCRDPDTCTGRQCPYGKECFHRRARLEQSASHVLVTNHSLLFTDMVADAQVLPEYHAVVLDEAHTLEDIATSHFGREVSSYGARNLAQGLKSFISGKRMKRDPGEGVSEKAAEVEAWAGKFELFHESFFGKAEEVFGQDNRTAWFDRDDMFPDEMSTALAALSFSLMELSSVLKDPENRDTSRAIADRCNRLAEALDFVFCGDDEGYVWWVNVKTWASGTNFNFHVAPIEVGKQMRTYLFDKVCPVILTSATLSSSEGHGADFGFIRSRLGIENCMELSLGSSFDYASNVMIYLPKGMRDPQSSIKDFKEQVTTEILNVFDIMKGRTFALFTSYNMLNFVAADLAKKREGINILKQGDLPRYVLLD